MEEIETPLKQPVRSRNVSWADPQASAELGKQLSGLAYLQALQNGEIPPPPIAELMNMRIAEVEEGRVVFTLEPAEFHYNPIGSVHGGVAATLLDSCMGCAVQSVLPLGTGYTTIELKVNYLRALSSQTGLVYAEGKIIHRGGRIATAEGRITDASGKLYAHGTTTCILLR
jgi:uncharacterized protein (TIGR00369 family)